MKIQVGWGFLDQIEISHFLPNLRRFLSISWRSFPDTFSYSIAEIKGNMAMFTWREGWFVATGRVLGAVITLGAVRVLRNALLLQVLGTALLLQN